jgi:class 3 adenylate cyclase
MNTLPSVELGVLGPLQVRQHGAPVGIPGAKPRAILTMLGLHGGSVVSAEALVELLWGDDPPRTATKALQTHISSLRRALGDGFILTEGTGWTLAESEVDASRYKSVARLGRDAVAVGETGQAVACFEEALALWRGIPELPDGRRGTSEKTRWVEGHAALVEDRADALLATGRAAEIIGDLEAAVADAPLRERRWGQLMLALYRAGRQGEALSAYQRARALLADELGVDPGPDLRKLEAAIVAQEAALDVVAAQRLASVTRAVTFLLTDIEGSTAAWEAEADAMAVALARHDELVEQVVTSRGGRLIKTRGEGDATFSVFERPSAAAAAALELQDAIVHEPWTLREPMRIRVALHTGEVELRDGDYFGRAVNRAARLRSLAVGGQILCSGATSELVIDSLPDDVVLADLGLRELRNLARPEHVFELRLETVEESAQPPTSDAPMARPSLPSVLIGTGPFVGRGTELEQLHAAWQTTLGAGASAVLIAGEPGVGKTRLAAEWSRQAYEQGAVVLYGRCDEDLGAPYQPFAEALRSLVPCVGTSRLRGLRGVEALLPLVPGLVDVVPDLAAPTRADPDTERYALFDALVALLETASTEAPVVLVLDDLHWAAKPTLLLLRHLLRFGDRARVQIVGTYRSTDLDRSHPLAAMLADLHRDGTASRISLSGLDEDDVSAYVAKAGYDDEELGHALASVTGGNPFFLIEALRHVDESGGVWDPSTLPQGVREAVSRRLSRLPIETNKALAAAAVVGSRFALDLVERVVGDDLVDAFDEAAKAGIVIEEPGGRYQFNHAIVRQSLLAELPSMRRMRLHQRIATTLEDEPGADDELLAELAHHYFECAWAGNAAKAVEYCRRAADQAMARLAYEGAAELYDHAVHALEELDDELPDRDDQNADLLLARCEALLAAGDVASAAGAVSQLQQATVDSARLSAWATCFDGQLSVLVHPERLDDVEAALGNAASALAQIDDAAGEAKAHTVRATCLARLGRVGDCEIALDDALTAARRAREHRRVNAVLASAPLAALWGPNPVPRAGGRCLDVVRLLRITTDSPAVEATSTRCQAVLEAFRGRDAAARRMIDSARRTVTELGLRHALLEVEQFAGIVELVLDDPAEAEPPLRQAYNGFRRMGLDADTAETAALLGRACLALNRDGEADELCTESERLAGHALKPSIAWRTLRAQLLSRGGDHDEARHVAEAAVALAERTDALVDHGDACLALATVLGAGGDAAGARAAAERAAELYERKGAAALADKARRMLGGREIPSPPDPPELPPVTEPDTACVRTGERVADAVNRGDWEEYERLFAPGASVESRRKIVGFTPIDVPFDDLQRQNRRMVEAGETRLDYVFIAVRGECLALSRLKVRTADASPGAPTDEFLQVYGIDEEGRVASQIWFDVEDMDAATAELDAAHARFEAEHPQVPHLDNACVRAVGRLWDAFDREAWDEVEAQFATEITAEYRRKIVGFSPRVLSPSDWARQVRQIRAIGGVRHHRLVIAVRGDRLALTRFEIGTADASPGAPQDELLHLFGLDNDGRIALHIAFDVEDMDAALAELDTAHARFEDERRRARRPENAASRFYERFKVRFAARDWGAIAEMVSENILSEDRRRVVNSGLGHGPDALIAELSAIADVGIELTSDVIATRGAHLVLSRVQGSGQGQGADAFYVAILDVIEVDADGRAVARIVFDLDDFEAALQELDSRYLAGEAAAYARTWSVVAASYVALNRRELPLTAPDCVNVDHRRETAFGPGDLAEYTRTGLDLDQGITIYVEEVHQLNSLAAAVTYAAHEMSQEGFNAEWRGIALFTIDGDLVNRCEVFDEVDIDAAIARFDQLSRPTPHLENAASQAYGRLRAYFAARDWDAMAAMLADESFMDDRRQIVGAGVRRGRDATMAAWRAIADIGATTITSVAIATRGTRLALCRTWAGTNGAFDTEALQIVDIDAHERMVTVISFGLDEFDAAIAELDARYLAGEAAAYAQTWPVVAGAYASLNRHELPPTTTDFANIDHRRGARFAPGELIAFLRAGWLLDQELNVFYIEAVHRLSALGAVVTQTGHGTSHEGFEAEWREVALFTVEGELINRTEVFDEADLDAAIARFEELSKPAPQLENTASRANARYVAGINTRDWDTLASLLAEDYYSDDRRRVTGTGTRRGRDAEIENVRVTTDLGAIVTVEVIATRGDRLVLTRTRVSFDEQQGFLADVLFVVETDLDGRIAATIMLDIEDIEAAFEELDARYVAGEAAAYGPTWSAISRAHAAMNRHEFPPTTPNWKNLDHRRARAFAPGDAEAYVHATWDLLAPHFNMYIEVVHRLSNCGVVVTRVSRGTSKEGFDAAWREICVSTAEGDLIDTSEIFDEQDIDAAIARFDELCRPTTRLENTASRANARYVACFNAREWDSMASILSEDYCSDDRRRVTGTGTRRGRDAEIENVRVLADLGVTLTVEVIATRGERLILTRTRASADEQQGFFDYALLLVETDLDGRLAATIMLDLEDIVVAFAELDARYLAGEAAANARTWSLVAAAYECYNRRELPPTTPDWVNVDRRRITMYAPGDVFKYVRGGWDYVSDISFRIEAVHQLSNLGAVVTHTGRGTSQEGFDAEWREIHVMTVDGDLFNRSEMFDEADVDVAIARFEELHPQPPRLENAASRVDKRFQACFAARDWDVLAEMLSDGFSIEDRRRVVNMGNLHGQDAELGVHAYATVGNQNVTSKVIATRAQRLALNHYRFSGSDQSPDAFRVEMLAVVEIDADEKMAAVIVFDADEIDAAIAELDARYLAGEAAPYSAVWSAVMQGFVALNRHERPLMTPDVVSIDHRRGRAFAPGDLPAFLDATWELMPRASLYIDEVHRLNETGVVITYVVHGTTAEGFGAEWRQINVLKIAGTSVSRCEMFDEADLDAAIAGFEQLSRPAARLENTAAQSYESVQAHFAARNWGAMAEALADEASHDDRRRVVGAGLRKGRDAVVAEFASIAEIGVKRITFDTIAIRGSRLVLSRSRASGRDPRADAFRTDVLSIAEIDADERIAALITFDPEDFDAAIAELDARYLAGEAAAHSETWLVIAEACAALNRGEMPATAPDLVDIDHRSLAAIGSGDLKAYLQAGLEDAPQTRIYIETVHRLTGFGGVITHVAKATSQDGFDAEWRITSFFVVGGDLINRYEIFDEADLDVALARFDELQPQVPRLENAASQVAERFLGHFAASDWDAMAEMLADNFFNDDRRPLVGFGVLHGRDAQMANMRAVAELLSTDVTSTVLATRAARLALVRLGFSVRGQGPDAFQIEALGVVGIDTDDRIAAFVVFDTNDFERATAELDARYLAGEGAVYSHTWSVISEAYAAFNRHELPAMDWATVDRRRASPFESSTMTATLRAMWDLTPDLTIHIEAVHQLSSFGAVVTHEGHGSSQEGFDAEWRATDVLTVDGDRITGCEIFDETDLDAALARFDELQPHAPRLEHPVQERFLAHFAARDWDAMGQDFADDYYCDDRRRVVNAGVRHGRDAAFEDLRVAAEIGLMTNITSDIIATRGERLFLGRTRWLGPDQRPEDFYTEVLNVVEIDPEERIAALVVFDFDHIDAALKELDARYLAGEAAAHADIWSVITKSYAGTNRHELPPTTADWENADHRRARAFAPGDLEAYLRTTYDNVVPDIHVYVEVVHRLSNIGAVVTRFARGTSPDGFEAEWREIGISTVRGDLINRSEIFDEADLDAALARFEELQPRAQRLENAASQVYERFQAHFAASDWDAIANMLTADLYSDDRRPVVGGGIRPGRDALIEDLRAVTDVEVTHATSDAIATRGGRLALARARYSRGHGEPHPFHVDFLQLVEIDADDRITALIAFDANDIDAASEELDARYLAGEAAAHSHTWTLVTRAYEALGRRQLPEATVDWVNIDHRRLAPIAAGDLSAYLRATWELSPQSSIRIEAVHRLSEVGAVVTHVIEGTSQQGFDAEWRTIALSTYEGDKINRCELFDEGDLDAALARFDELLPHEPCLENAASRVGERYRAHFAAGNWDAMADIIADDFFGDDRRRVVGSGVRIGREAQIADMRAIADLFIANMTWTNIATRGDRLVLFRVGLLDRDHKPDAFRTEVLCILEIDADDRIVASISFDPNDVDAAIKELDARYLAGEASAHSHTWTALTQVQAAYNRHEVLPTTEDWVNIDHRRGRAFTPGDVTRYLRATYDVAPNVKGHIEAVHRLTNLGAVATEVVTGTSQEGFDAEWREIGLFVFEGDRICRFEMFDEADLNAALARFDELQPQPPRLENAASQVDQRYWTRFAARDWGAMAELLAADISTEDRRRVVNAGVRHGRDSHIAEMRAVVEVGVENVTSTIVATRGLRLAVTRITGSNGEIGAGELSAEALNIVEINADNKILSKIGFDADDIDAAIGELDARYLAGEAAAHADAWSLIVQAYTAVNRHEMPPTTPDWVNIDHRRGRAFAPGDLKAYLRATWDLAPNVAVYVETAHRLSNLGGVITHCARGSTREGFDAEWREVILLTFEAGRVNHFEVFDETDLDAALARFDELDRQASAFQNAATATWERLVKAYNRRDVDGFLALTTQDGRSEDRRKGLRHIAVGLEWQKTTRAWLDAPRSWRMDVEILAIRGSRLSLSRNRCRDTDEADQPVTAEILAVTEVNEDGLVCNAVSFDPDDIDDAFAELIARWIASGKAAYPEVVPAIDPDDGVAGTPQEAI